MKKQQAQTKATSSFRETLESLYVTHPGDGWKSREEVAEEMGITPEYVLTALKPAIAAGKIENKSFRIYSPTRKMHEKRTYYRVTG